MGRFGDAHGCPGPTEEIILSTHPLRALLTTTAVLAVLIPGQTADRAEAAAKHPAAQLAEPVTDLLALRARPAAASRSAFAGRSLLDSHSERVVTAGGRTTVHRPTAQARRALTAAQRRMIVQKRRSAKAIRARIRVVAFARAQRGDWYQYGAEGPSRWDCSGLTRGSMRAAGVRLAHSSRSQANKGTRVSSRHARPGDLVVYDGHVGILSGRWRMVDAPGTGRRVVERTVYRSRSLQFRRVIG